MGEWTMGEWTTGWAHACMHETAHRAHDSERTLLAPAWLRHTRHTDRCGAVTATLVGPGTSCIQQRHMCLKMRHGVWCISKLQPCDHSCCMRCVGLGLSMCISRGFGVLRSLSVCALLLDWRCLCLGWSDPLAHLSGIPCRTDSWAVCVTSSLIARPTLLRLGSIHI